MFLKFYSRMQHDQKVIFWQIISNISLTIFTFWMGLSIQDVFVDTTSKYNERMVRMEFVDKVYPMYVDLNNIEFYSNAAKDLAINAQKKGHTTSIKSAPNLNDYFSNNTDEFINDARKAVNIMSQFKHYTDQETSSKISLNNGKILLLAKIIELKHREKDISPDKIKDAIFDYMCSIEYICSSNYNSNAISVADLSNELIEYINNENVYGWESIICSEIGIAMIENNMIVGKYLNPTEDGKTKMSIFERFKHFDILIFGLLIVIVLSLIFTRFIVPKKSENYIREEDHKKVLHKLEIAESQPFISKAVLVSLENEISRLKKTIDTKDDIIEQDILELKRLRNELKKQQASQQ